MALIIDLKPGEKFLVGDAVITNDDQRTRLHIAGDSPIMREKDILKEEDADTPCKQVYFLVQCMYMSPKPEEYHDAYFKIIQDIQKASPHSSFYFMTINDRIMDAHYYKALKAAKELIKFEEELLSNV